MMLEIETSLPGAVAEMTYAKNHHWLKLRDSEGRELVLIEQGVVKYHCAKCNFVFFSPTNPGKLKCPLCGGQTESLWMRPQVSLIPEEESDFVLGKPKED